MEKKSGDLPAPPKSTRGADFVSTSLSSALLLGLSWLKFFFWGKPEKSCPKKLTILQLPLLSDVPVKIRSGLFSQTKYKV